MSTPSHRDGVIWEVDTEQATIDGVDADGRPDPAYAAALGLVPAPLGRRAVAFACDAGLLMMLQLPFWIGGVPLLLTLMNRAISPYGFVNHPTFVLAVVMTAVSVALTIVYGTVQWMLHGRRGVTIGKAVVGIRTVNVRTLERPGILAVLLRFVVFAASGVVPLAGTAILLLSPLFDPEQRGRGWHDRLSRVWLVDVREGLNPFDEKRLRIARKTVKADPVPERTALPSLATSRAPGAAAEYRPGSRISAGVLGASRSAEQPSAPARPPAPAMPAAAPATPSAELPEPARPTASRAPEPAAPEPSPPEPGPRRTPAPPVPVAAPSPPRRVDTLGLRFDTGETIAVNEPVLLGRDPEPGASGVPGGARPVRVADATMTLSKTHALVRPARSGIEIVDCGSTNGCGVIRSGEEVELAAGASAVAAVGDTVRLGDRTAEVIRMIPSRGES